mgnify:FL=1|jgi:hypothetical protein
MVEIIINSVLLFSLFIFLFLGIAYLFFLIDGDYFGGRFSKKIQEVIFNE